MLSAESECMCVVFLIIFFPLLFLFIGFKLEKKSLSFQQVTILNTHIFVAAELSPLVAGAE